MNKERNTLREKKKLTIEIDADKHRALKVAASNAKMTMKQIMEMLINAFMIEFEIKNDRDKRGE